MKREGINWVHIDELRNYLYRGQLEGVPKDEVLSLMERMEGGEVIEVEVIRILNEGEPPRLNLPKDAKKLKECSTLLEAYARLHSSFLPIKIIKSLSQPRCAPRAPQPKPGEGRNDPLARLRRRQRHRPGAIRGGLNDPEIRFEEDPALDEDPF